MLLGGRGAGKSAAIDLLRFAFQAEPQTDDVNHEVFTNRIVGFLQSVGEVLVVLVGTDGETYVITRSGEYEKPGARSQLIFTDPARVYQVVDENLIQRDIPPLDLLGIEFYGQGEVARLADRVNEQLRLIDENLDLSDATASIAEAERQLKEGENRLIEHQRLLEELRTESANRQDLEDRRDRLAESLADPIFDERTRWDHEETWLQSQQDWIQTILNKLPESIPSRIDVTIDIEQSSAKTLLQKVQETSDRILADGQTDLARFRENLEAAKSEIEDYRIEWNIAFETAKNHYRTRLAELGAANLNQVATEHRSVKRELTHIESNVEPEIERIDSEIASLKRVRAALLSNLRAARCAIRRSRSGFVEELNSKLGGNVSVELSTRDISLFFDAIDSPLQGSGMQHREDQLSLVCEAFTTEEFVAIMRTGSINQLTAIGVTENNASRMTRNLTEDVLYRVERVDIPQLPSIRIRREGDTEYTDLSSLSVGEKCSAILSIALLSKGKPLVIDQPEDDLDHAFVIDSIVQGIRTAKSGRQIIAATHNPNIPVLGDAEMVFRVARRVGRDVCKIQNSGGLELPRVTEEVQSLEGGAEAFEQRKQGYSSVT